MSKEKMWRVIDICLPGEKELLRLMSKKKLSEEEMEAICSRLPNYHIDLPEFDFFADGNRICGCMSTTNKKAAEDYYKNGGNPFEIMFGTKAEEE